MWRPEPRSVLLATRAYGCAAAALAITTALLFRHEGIDAAARLSWIAAASVAVTASLIWIAGIWSAAGVYVGVFWCFHFGLAAVLAIGYLTPADLSPWTEAWVLSPFAPDAAALALAGLLAFAAGAALMAKPRAEAAQSAPSPSGGPVHGQGFAGAMLVFLALAVWCALVISSAGASGFFTSYEEYLEQMSDFGWLLSGLWPLLGCGIVLSATGARGWHRTAALVAFGGFSLVALPLGLRSEVMFPFVAVLLALARCGKKLTPARAAAIATAFLLVIPIIRDLRASGLRDLPATLSAPGLGALAEMGESLHPVEKVVRWHAEGEPYELGATYWAPFERAAARILPGLQASTADDDMRLMNVLVLDRIGAIGFSPVAEAYRNFGPIGVVVVLGLIGVIVGAIDRARDAGTSVLLIAVVYVPLLVNVRNSFVSVPAQCALGVAVALTIVAARHVSSVVVGRPNARAAYVRR